MIVIIKRINYKSVYINDKNTVYGYILLYNKIFVLLLIDGNNVRKKLIIIIEEKN